MDELRPFADIADDGAKEMAQPVLSVSQLNNRIRDTLQTDFDDVWVSGEVTDLARPQSGHIYLGLKDERSQIRGVMWRSLASRLPFELKDGMEVICQGGIDVYPPRGTYQLIIRQIEPLGIGALQLALIQLRDRLAAEGLFNPQFKKPLPRFPRRIAVITSPTGAAVRDFLEVVRRRWQGTQITVVPTRVQGAEAVEEIVAALQTAQRLMPPPDVLVVTRGGGSLEDLWCFNDERVVREIFAAPIPVVSAIGHEIDVTLADLVADVRALTPTEAAERVVPDQHEIRSGLGQLHRLLQTAVQRRLEFARTRLESLGARPVLRRPLARILDLNRMLDELDGRMQRAVQTRHCRATDQVHTLAGKLQSLSPLHVLARGYSVTQKAEEGTLLRDVRQLQVGDRVVTRLAKGRFVSRVERVD